MLPSNVDQAAKEWADSRLRQIEEHMEKDAVAIISPLTWGLEHRVRVALEGLENRRDGLIVIIDTAGGVVEVVERIARVLRHNYETVDFLVPDRALSAGTVLVMSGDAIWMDYHSCLGPIDPQVEREGKLVPALSYLAQYERLNAKAADGQLSTAEVVLLQKLDLAELHQFELARDLSISLLKDWLANYKFKDWNVTETRGLEVTDEMKRERAAEIAEALNNHERWHTHGRGIDLRTLQDELNLRIDDFGEDPDLQDLVWNYFWFLRDHMDRSGSGSWVHTRTFF